MPEDTTMDEIAALRAREGQRLSMQPPPPPNAPPPREVALVRPGRAFSFDEAFGAADLLDE